MTAPIFRYSRIVDLSRPLVPGQEQHPWLRFETSLEHIGDDPEPASSGRRWYVVTQIAMSGHAGTHVEAPLHAVQDGASAGELPVESFFGEGVILDLSDAPPAAPIGLSSLQSAVSRAGGIHPGDIVLLRFDWDQRASSEHPPYPEPVALRWLVDQQIKLLGIDSPGLEVPGNPDLVNHHILFDRGIPLIESLTRLSDLRSFRVYLFAVPLPAFGADSVPLRVLAFEGT